MLMISLTGCTDSVEMLKKDLSSTDVGTRLRAINSLGDMGSKASSTVPTLIDIVRRDSDMACRRAAARALGRIGERAAIQPLKDVQSAANDGGLQREIKDALAKLKE